MGQRSRKFSRYLLKQEMTASRPKITVMRKKFTLLFIVFFCLHVFFTNAQDIGSNGITAQPIPDRTVPFSVTGSGESMPMIWGLDTAWPSESNMRRGVAFMGPENVDLVRVSFQPTHPLVNGDLQQEQIDWVNVRLSLADLAGPNAKLMLNSDHPSVDPWYSGNAENWAALMDVTAKRYQEAGRTIVSIAPFNEPDYGWGQGTLLDFYNICSALKTNPRFDNIRIAGGNTLNNDQALTWYNSLKDKLDEGNTHQLGGTFDNFAIFYETVRANGHHATGDELHNVMEPMVGVHYGMQTGIWWGTAELARGEFVKASDGVRLGYAEHRPNWTAASVYRHPNGKVQAFGGTSERQAVTTTFRFLSKDRDVYFDGYGPQREYTMVMPGGTGYNQGQTNAERVVNITWGDDIQPVINGRYLVVNRNSGKVLQVAGGSTTSGTLLQQGTNTGVTYQQWDIVPVDSRIGGDFSYFGLKVANGGKSADVFNWSLDNGGAIALWDDTKGANQQWYFEYAGDGWFYIRSRHSAKCLDVTGASTGSGASIIQNDNNGSMSQQWRLLPIDATIEFEAPGAPTNLVAAPNAESILLSWTASPNADVTGYHIFRAESAGGPYNTIARNVTTTSFIDNTTTTSTPYYYVVKAVDKSLNRSVYSSEVSATATGSNDLVMHLKFEGDMRDHSINHNNAGVLGGLSFAAGRVDAKSINLDGKTGFAQLPSNVASHEQITVSAWVNWNGGAASQRIFDFGNGESQYMSLTPKAVNGQMRFAIKNENDEQTLSGPALTVGKWTHVAVTLGASRTTLYVDGVEVAASETITLRPSDFRPVLNYIGRSQLADPLLDGKVDDFRVYNYALSSSEITELVSVITDVAPENRVDNDVTLAPVPAKDIVRVYDSGKGTGQTHISINTLNGASVLSRTTQRLDETELDVSALAPGVYVVRLTSANRIIMKKLVIHR